MIIQWMKCQNNVWCKLDSVNLEHQHFNNMSGVYVIWHAGSYPATVYVGCGFIKDRLTHHRTNPNIQQKYKHLGLYVTWASILEREQEGVELYLANKLLPKERERHPDVPPIEVNLPW